MFMKASYILASTAAIGLMFFAAPRGGPLTSSPDRASRSCHIRPGRPIAGRPLS